MQPTSYPTPHPTPDLPIEDIITCGDTITGSTTSEFDINYYLFDLEYSADFEMYSVVFDACQSGFDTILYLWKTDGSVVTACDDSCGIGCAPNEQLTVSLIDTNELNSVYVFGVGGYDTLYGTYNIEVKCNNLNMSFPDTTNRSSVCCDCVTESLSWTGCRSDELCNVLVCSRDNYCCNNHWDSICASNAQYHCNSTLTTNLCGLHRYCYYIDVHSVSNENKTYQQLIFNNNDNNHATEFDIYFTARMDEVCVSPIISFKYEKIDYDESNEYIDVYDDNNVLIKRCGAGKYTDNECGVYDECIHEFKVIKDISIHEPYHIQLVESSFVNGECLNHTYSINAIISIKCQAIINTMIPESSTTVTIPNTITSTKTQTTQNSLISTTTTTQIITTDTFVNGDKKDSNNSNDLVVIIIPIIIGFLIICCLLIIKELRNKRNQSKVVDENNNINKSIPVSSDTEHNDMYTIPGISNNVDNNEGTEMTVPVVPDL